MEMTILRELDWQVTVPNAHYWLVRMMRLVRASEATTQRAEYFAQRMLQEYNMLEYKPSMLAAAAAHLSLVAAPEHREKWPESLSHLTGYQASDLHPCCKSVAYHINVQHTQDASRATAKLSACRKKFARDEFSKVSDRLKLPIVPRRS